MQCWPGKPREATPEVEGIWFVWRSGFSGMAGQINGDLGRMKMAPAERTVRAWEGRLPVLAWLSLGGLLPSRAHFRFTKHP
jgi:hypothetical protein